jgi:hypothetical protein
LSQCVEHCDCQAVFEREVRQVEEQLQRGLSLKPREHDRRADEMGEEQVAWGEEHQSHQQWDLIQRHRVRVTSELDMQNRDFCERVPGRDERPRQPGMRQADHPEVSDHREVQRE